MTSNKVHVLKNGACSFSHVSLNLELASRFFHVIAPILASKCLWTG